MPLAKNLSAYEDIRPHFERALSSPRGIRITTPGHGAAVSLRARLYALRKLEREASLDIFDPEDPRRGLSPYENLKIELQDNCVVIYHTEPLTVEEL